MGLFQGRVRVGFRGGLGSSLGDPPSSLMAAASRHPWGVHLAMIRSHLNPVAKIAAVAKIGLAHLWALNRGDRIMRLTPPKQMTFFISVALAVIAVVVRLLIYMDVEMPITLPTGGFLILLFGYLVLLAGNVLDDV